MKENKDFKIVDHPKKKDHFAIRIVTGPYAGTMYHYSRVKFVEELGVCRISYSYEIDSSPGSALSQVALKSDPRFQGVCSAILDSVLKKYGS
jgi:hypothetical protein